MKYYVSVTDLHSALVNGIRTDGDGLVVEYPMRGNLRSKLGALPRVGWALARAAVDPNAHVFVSHPFTSVTAAFTAVARKLSLFDDGTAYYNDPPLPHGKREAIDRWLTRRWFDWKAIETNPSATYPDLIANSAAASFYAIFPGLVNAERVPVEAIDTERAFPVCNLDDPAGIFLFLDTRDDALPDLSLEAILAALSDAAQESPSGVLHFRAHPTQASRVSRALRQLPWASEVTEPLESFSQHTSITRLYSFFSSGALSVKLTQPAAQIVNLRNEGGAVNPSLLRLYRHLDAQEVVV